MPIKYIPYIPEPIEGQAVLDNFKRVLKYKGAYDVKDSIRRGMPLYEMEKLETVGENADGNMVVRGECVSACAYLKEKGIEVDLVYIDPPFASGAAYAKQVFIRRNPKVAQAIAQAEQELDLEELRTFEEKMYGDVWDKEKYLNWMYENLMAIKSVMSETASIYVHLDWHIGHYVKILLDEIFGEDNFKNEIVWCYTGGTDSKNTFGRKHDTIFFYTKQEEYVFNGDFMPFAEGTLKRFNREDENGRYKENKLADGRITKTYMKEEGKLVPDYWNFPIVNHTYAESVDYSTQKPEALLERIIKASSDEGMVVADFFGGSGVTAAVASRLGRRFIHCDVGINSVQTTRDRLKSVNAEFDVLEIKDGVQLFRNPVQTMDKIKSLIPGLKNEDSLDSFWEGAISDSKYGTIPVYVPNLMDSSAKLLDLVLINRILHQAIPELDSSIKKVIVYYIDITDKEEIDKFISADDSTDIEIELRDLKTILDDVVIGDYVEFHTEENENPLIGGYSVVMDRFLSDRIMQKIEEFNQEAYINSSEKKPYKPIEISEEGLELIEFLSVDCTASEGEWHSDSEVKIDKNGFVVVNGSKTKDFWDGKLQSPKKPLRLKVRNICGDETVWLV